MRVILLGTESINLATAHHLAELGYEVTIVDVQNKSSVNKKNCKDQAEDQNFIAYFEKKLNTLGVKFKKIIKVNQFIAECNIVRGISVTNENSDTETLIADRFVVGMNENNYFILKSLKIYFSSQFKPFRDKQYYKPFVGKSRYSNLYLNRTNNVGGSALLSESGKLLADFIYNPSFVEPPIVKPIAQKCVMENKYVPYISFFSFFSKTIQMRLERFL